MKPVNVILLFAILLWIFLKTVSYGKWTWDRKNVLGALFIIMIALVELFLPIYVLYFTE